jgi:hypothetical protein
VTKQSVLVKANKLNLVFHFSFPFFTTAIKRSHSSSASPASRKPEKKKERSQSKTRHKHSQMTTKRAKRETISLLSPEKPPYRSHPNISTHTHNNAPVEHPHEAEKLREEVGKKTEVCESYTGELTGSRLLLGWRSL